MKVAIASVYYYENYGSMLQAFATQTVLDDIGVENETICIDGLKGSIARKKFIYYIIAVFTTNFLSQKLGTFLFRARNKIAIGKNAYNYRIRRNKFKQFKKSHFRCTPKVKSMSELTSYCKNFNAVIVGSDQLWLPANIFGDYFTLSFVPQGVKRISYATSFGQREIPFFVKKKIKKFIEKFDSISVREEEGKNIIEELLEAQVAVVCDPTLLVTKEKWEILIGKNRIFKEKYILCYFLGKNEGYRRAIKAYAEIKGIKIVSLPHLYEYVDADEKLTDVKLYDIDPFDFISLIRDAEYICTDSFHATVFSVMFEKKFVTFARYNYDNKDSTNDRLTNMLNRLNIMNRYTDDASNISSILDEEIDYVDVMKRKKVFYDESMDFLLKALE